MKNWILLLGVSLFCLSSCRSHDYEKAIAEWIQTDKNGTWTDWKFEMLELIETKDITVSDSVQILQDKFNELQDKNVAIYTKKIDRLEGFVSRLEKNPFAPEATTESYRKTLRETEVSLDSIKKLTFQSVYDGRSGTDVLAKLLKCKYAVVPPMLKARQERVSEFLLSPDMKTCWGRMKATTK